MEQKLASKMKFMLLFIAAFSLLRSAATVPGNFNIAQSIIGDGSIVGPIIFGIAAAFMFQGTFMPPVLTGSVLNDIR